MARLTQIPVSSQSSGRQLRQRPVKDAEVIPATQPRRSTQRGAKRQSTQPTGRIQVAQPVTRGKVTAAANRTLAAKKTAGGNRAASMEVEEDMDVDDDEEEEEEEEEEQEQEQEEQEIMVQQTSPAQKQNSKTTKTGLQLQMARLLEQAAELNGGYEAIREVMERHRPEPDQPPRTEPAEDVESDVASEDAEPEPTPEPVRHIRKTPIQRKRPVPWSVEEERFFMNLVSKHGAKWSRFESTYGRAELFGRNQIALKDKARNIMRRIIDGGKEDIWLKRYPMWAEVSVGYVSRRGVHGYDQYRDGMPPEKMLKMRREKRGILEIDDE